MEKSDLLNKLFEAKMPPNEAQAIISSPVWPKIHSRYCSCGECLAWKGGEEETKTDLYSHD